MNTKKLMIVDGNSILNRAFYGLQGANLLATSDGLYTNAVFGFLNILYKYLEEENPTHLCVAFDLKAPTFRHKEFDGYKAKRKGMPEELAVQMPVIKEVLDTMNIKRLEYEGFEADDILGSISLCAQSDGFEVVIITGDKDSLQLASETTRIKIPSSKAGKTETTEYDNRKVFEKYGVTPKQFIDVKGLMGDTSDNIPGVPGIGEKTALSLIIEFDSIENLYENIESIKKKGVKEKLIENKELAIMSKRLATIDRNMPKMCQLEELERKEFQNDKLYELFKRLEFKSFIEKFKLSNTAPSVNKTTITKTAECIGDRDKLSGLVSEIKIAKKMAIYYFIDKLDSFRNSLVGMAVSYDEDKTFYININKIGEEIFIKEFKEIFESTEINKFGHDLKAFIVYLKNRGIEFNGLGFDTMIAAYIISPSNDNYDISLLADEHLNIEVLSIEQLTGKGKNFTPFGKIPLETILSVAGVYSETVLKSKAIFEDLIKENNQEELFYSIELPLVKVLADMEFQGFKVNVDTLKQFSVELEERIGILTNEIYKIADEEFNINSTKQLGVILFEKLDLPVIKKTKTGYSTDAEVLEQLLSKHEIVSKILEYRQLVKLKSTYIEGLLAVINPDTGKIHSSFNQTVTVTGRISSTEPNLQNIPIKLEMGRKIRKVFVPRDENYLLLDADYSQIELRVLAHITNDENMISAFLNKEDIHTATASKVFNVPLEEVTSSIRAKAKAVNFGIVYGIGDFSLSKDIGVTRKEARMYIDEYLEKYPNIKKYMQDIVLKGKEEGFVTTLFNRRRYLPELGASNFNIRSFGERIAMNTPIQGSAADIIKIAMVKVYNELSKRNLKSRLILQVHDELIIETYRDEKEEVANILKESMENAVKLRVPMDVEVKYGENWYKAK